MKEDKGKSIGEYLLDKNFWYSILKTIIAQEERMKAQTQKDTLFNYLKNRRYALESYIQAYKDMAEEYPETKDVNKIRIAGTELQLQEINKVIDYCEKRGRY